MKRHISLSELKKLYQVHSGSNGPLKDMSLFTRSRLSVQPVSKEEYDFILSLEKAWIPVYTSLVDTPWCASAESFCCLVGITLESLISEHFTISFYFMELFLWQSCSTLIFVDFSTFEVFTIHRFRNRKHLISTTCLQEMRICPKSAAYISHSSCPM
jgi:hypothetical protein